MPIVHDPNSGKFVSSAGGSKVSAATKAYAASSKKQAMSNIKKAAKLSEGLSGAHAHGPRIHIAKANEAIASLKAAGKQHDPYRWQQVNSHAASAIRSAEASHREIAFNAKKASS